MLPVYGCCIYNCRIISYVRSEDPEIKLAKFLQLIGTIKRTLLKRVRKETVLKFYKTLAVPVLLCDAENWTLTVSQKKRIEAAEMKLLRPLAGYTLRDHKYNDDIRSELGVQSITEILDIYRTNWHDQLLRMEPHHVPLQVKNPGRGTDQLAQALRSLMMIICDYTV
jgi:hypothetical protein